MNPALVMFDDAELESAVGEAVKRRRTIAEWPLSWTQSVEFASGRRFACKSMLPPLVESDFYAAATAAVLPAYEILGRFDNCANILIEWIDSPSLADVHLSSAELLAHARNVVREIGEIGPGCPAYLDVGTPEKWADEAASTLKKLRQLVSGGTFSRISPALIDDLEPWVTSAEVLDRIGVSSRLVHRDLKRAHVFPADGGYRVIDWQAPSIAPADVDLVWLLEESGVDSYQHVDPATYGVSFFLHLRWATVAQHDFFPGFAGPLFEGWASDALAALSRVHA